MFESARLSDHHSLEGFDCGKESLDAWLITQARRADSSGSRTSTRGPRSGNGTSAPISPSALPK